MVVVVSGEAGLGKGIGSGVDSGVGCGYTLREELGGWRAVGCRYIEFMVCMVSCHSDFRCDHSLPIT